MDGEIAVQPPESLDDARRRWVEVVGTGNVDDYVEIMTPDVAWLPPGMEAMSGREGMREWLKPAFAAFEEYVLELEVSRSAIHGDWAIEEGTFTSSMTEKSTGQRGQHRGRYVAIWKHGPDGWMLDRYADLGPPPQG